ncbi:MAG: DoxX family membrane protein [Verrucomicrobiae bacterium]|nr:DoxX family membrane protein [Verrucomicrobiae bacterium]
MRVQNRRKMLELGLRVAVGGVFVLAGALKVLQPAEFANDVARYRMLPEWSVNVFALCLPWVELLAGLLLVLGAWQKGAALLIAVLNVVFLAAVSVALWRGLEVCGCFGAAVARKASGWTLLQDAVLLAGAIWLCRRKGTVHEEDRGKH